MASTATALTVVDQVEKSPAVMMLDARSSALLELLPDEAAALRFRRVATQALVKNPDLLRCTPESVVSSIFEAAAMGLEPTGAAGGAHLVPYNVNVGTKDKPQWVKQAQLIPDYRGIIRLVTKPPSDVFSMEARVVKEGDEFRYQLGSDAFVEHTPTLSADRSAKATTHVYSIARLRAGGTPLIDVEDRAGIERVQKRGKERGFSPWSSDWDEMAKKTIIKRHAKVLPVRPEIRSLLTREDELSGTIDRDEPTGAAAAATGSRTSRLAARLGAVPATEARQQDEEPEAPTGVTDGESAAAAAGDEVEGESREVAWLTQEEFLAELEKAGIDKGYASERAKAMWPDRPARTPLTPEQRVELLRDVTTDL